MHTPTFTGVSDRAHLLTPAVGLGTHVQDVVAYLEAYDLTGVVLVGHSCAGQVVTAVADRVPRRLRTRVYLDAFVGDDGDAAIDLLPDTVAGHYRESVAGPGFGWLTSHPWLTYAEPLRLNGSTDVPAAFVECTGWMRVFRAHAGRAAARGWPVHEVATGHEVMVTAPRELAGVLLAIA